MNPPRRERVTITAVARALGVSVATVSNAYNRPDQISAALRGRVLAEAARLGYPGPDPAARSLRSRRMGALGVIYTDPLSFAFADPAAVRFLRGIAQSAEAARLGLLLIPGRPEADPGTAIVRDALVDGLIVYSVADDDPLAAAARERRLPLVTVDQPRLPGVPFVGIDDEGAARAIAAHLLGLGHRRFGIIAADRDLARDSGPLAPDECAGITFAMTRARLRGYVSALAAAGIDPATVPIYSCGDNTVARGRAAARWLLDRTPRPTALLVMSDRLALGALAFARASGLTVPRELSIAGFDDIREAALASPTLTTIRQPHRNKGRAAGRLALGLLGGEHGPGEIVLPTRLILRDSTAPPADR